MNKLSKMKEWLTLPDAAKHLAIVFGEEVTEADVLQLAMDREISLSVYFANKITIRNLKEHLIGPGGISKDPCIPLGHPYLIMAHPLENGDFSFSTLIPTDEIIDLSEGSYDLARDFYSSDFDIRKKYLSLSNGIELKHTNRRYLIKFIGGIGELLSPLSDDELKIANYRGDFEEKELILKSSLINGDDIEEPENERHFMAKSNRQLKQEGINYCIMYELPKDSFLIVRTQILREFEQKLIEAPEQDEQKSLSTSERNTLLTIIGIMAKDGYGDDLSKPYSLAKDVKEAADLLGIKVSDDTIASKLKDAKKILNGKY